ncbi:hypothetical protein SGODD07_01746 [Streptococcus gordonii]|uniref:Uncharacterized protein n=1 Tax=Streptococcus gordonii TaxID=1302 RepID=A0A139N1A8_STRGN|nr:hypothetical protein SGODD07_01746 [Streptococcus gordonii]
MLKFFKKITSVIAWVSILIFFYKIVFLKEKYKKTDIQI